MAEHSERRESVRVPMTFQVATTDGHWVSCAGDLSINGLRLQDLSPFRFMPLTIVSLQLPDELQPRRVQAVIKRYFIAEHTVHAAAIFEGLDFDTEVAIARCIDAYSA
jgi:hypothetical protein